MTVLTRKTAACDDSWLISEVDAGSVEAFAELDDRFCHRAYAVAFSVCRDEGRAQDAVQEAFLSLWKSPSSYRHQRGTVAAWLMAVVRHRAIDLVRRHGNNVARWASDDQLSRRPALGDVSETVLQQDSADHLRHSLVMLSDEQREVITLAYYGQLSHTEIAAQLGIPSGTVKGRMRLGLQKLRTTTTNQRRRESNRQPASVMITSRDRRTDHRKRRSGQQHAVHAAPLGRSSYVSNKTASVLDRSPTLQSVQAGVTCQLRGPFARNASEQRLPGRLDGASLHHRAIRCTAHGRRAGTRELRPVLRVCGQSAGYESGAGDRGQDLLGGVRGIERAAGCDAVGGVIDDRPDSAA